jgi:hypothetical protein
MPYDDLTPGHVPLVIIEWLDIASGEDIVRRWTAGWLLSTTYVSEGRQCARTAITWDENGWDELSTYKLDDIECIHYPGVD